MLVETEEGTEFTEDIPSDPRGMESGSLPPGGTLDPGLVEIDSLGVAKGSGGLVSPVAAVVAGVAAPDVPPVVAPIPESDVAPGVDTGVDTDVATDVASEVATVDPPVGGKPSDIGAVAKLLPLLP